MKTGVETEDTEEKQEKEETDKEANAVLVHLFSQGLCRRFQGSSFLSWGRGYSKRLLHAE